MFLKSLSDRPGQAPIEGRRKNGPQFLDALWAPRILAGVPEGRGLSSGSTRRFRWREQERAPLPFAVANCDGTRGTRRWYQRKGSIPGPLLFIIVGVVPFQF